MLSRQPGWPVVLLFAGYPIWWVLGIPDVIGLIAAIAMVVALVRRPRIRVPRGFGIIALFLVWVLLSFALIQIAAPGAVDSHSANRYLTSSWRLLWYVKAVVLLLYLGNERDRLSQKWICRTFGWMFVYIVAGGLLGVVAPSLQFPSALELVLPHSLTATPFVHSNIHPIAAERFADYLGGQFRTSAPFPYANVWGLNFACFAPFFVLGWLGRDAGRRRIVGWAVLAVAIVPVVLSLNRGLWLALGTVAVLVVARAVYAGRLRVVLWMLVGGAIAATVIMLSPLGSTIANRLSGDQPSSETTRSNLTSLTVSGVREASPILGFGATRNVQGNFTSIAGGATSSCPRCVVPALGTQGQLLLVMFTQGFIGVALYFGFLLWQFVRHIRIRSRYATAGLAVLAAHFVTSTVYSADNLAVLAIFGAVALLWRSRTAERIDDPSGTLFDADESTLGNLTSVIRRHWKAALVPVIVGGLVGGTLAYLHGPSYQATVSIYVADDPIYPVLQPVPSTLDAVARTATSSATLNAMQVAAGPDVRVDAASLTTTATPNTKIIHLTYAGTSAASARVIVQSAAATVLRLRLAELRQQQQSIVAQLEDRGNSLATALETMRTTAARVGQPLAVLAQERDLLGQAQKNDARIAAVENITPSAGQLLGPSTLRVDTDRQRVDVANGIAIGLLLGAALLAMAASRTLRTPVGRGSIGPAPVLLRGAPESLDGDYLLFRYDPGAVVAAGTQPAADAFAARLDDRITAEARRRRPFRVIVVVADGERLRTVRRVVEALQRSGADVLGLVTLEAERTRADALQVAR